MVAAAPAVHRIGPNLPHSLTRPVHRTPESRSSRFEHGLTYIPVSIPREVGTIIIIDTKLTLHSLPASLLPPFMSLFQPLSSLPFSSSHPSRRLTAVHRTMSRARSALRIYPPLAASRKTFSMSLPLAPSRRVGVMHAKLLSRNSPAELGGFIGRSLLRPCLPPRSHSELSSCKMSACYFSSVSIEIPELPLQQSLLIFLTFLSC